MDPELRLGEEVHQREHDCLEAKGHGQVELDGVRELVGVVEEWVDIIAVFT